MKLIGTFDCCKDVHEGDCPDVRELYGGRYRIGVEDPYFNGTQCPWHYVVVGQNGHISPSGVGMLWVCYGSEGSAEDHSFPVAEFPKYARQIKAVRR